MNTTTTDSDGGRRRRRHSPEFKADAITACRRPGVSIAGVALKRGLNANLLRRWVAQFEANGGGAIELASRGEVSGVAQPAPAFVPLALPAPSATASADIRIELRRGSTAVTLSWPSSAAAECAGWMRELLR